MSTLRYPQCNGQVESINREVKCICFFLFIRVRVGFVVVVGSWSKLCAFNRTIGNSIIGLIICRWPHSFSIVAVQNGLARWTCRHLW